MASKKQQPSYSYSPRKNKSQAAALAGHAQAMFDLGCALFDGLDGSGADGPAARGVLALDKAAGLEWFRRAAAVGRHPHAMTRLARACWRGDGVPQSRAAAAEWYDQAARAAAEAATRDGQVVAGHTSPFSSPESLPGQPPTPVRLLARAQPEATTTVEAPAEEVPDELLAFFEDEDCGPVTFQVCLLAHLAPGGCLLNGLVSASLPTRTHERTHSRTHPRTTDGGDGGLRGGQSGSGGAGGAANGGGGGGGGGGDKSAARSNDQVARS